MKNAQKQLEFWRRESDQFEGIVQGWKNFDRELTDALCSARCNQFGIEWDEQTTLDTKIKALRRLFAVQTKHWKTIVRYPNTDKNQFMMLRFHPLISEADKKWVSEKYNFKFPFKVDFYGNNEDNNCRVTSVKGCKYTVTQEGKLCTISARFFVTSNNEINKISKEFYNQTPSTSC